MWDILGYIQFCSMFTVNISNKHMMHQLMLEYPIPEQSPMGRVKKFNQTWSPFPAKREVHPAQWKIFHL